MRSPITPLPEYRLERAIDDQMRDLFRLEVEEQAKILNEGLITLES
jgi:hypothetical protein